MSDRIAELKLHHFRGATQPVTIPLGTDHAMVMIFGENGTGKSSLVDALDFVLNENPGSIANRSSTNPKKHLPALGTTHGDVRVELETVAKDRWEATLTSGGKASVTQTQGTAPKPSLLVLRRADLLLLVESRPADRYAAVKPFIDVSGVEKGENALRAAERDVQGRYETAVTTTSEAEEALTGLFDNERASDEPNDVIDWARSRAAQDLDQLRDGASRLDRLGREIDTAERLAAAWRADAERAANLQDTLDRAQAHHDTVRQRATTEPDLLPLLQAAKRYLGTHAEPETCPLCTQAVEPDTLRTRIDAYLDAQREVAEAVAEVEQASRAIRPDSTARSAEALTNHVQSLAADLADDPPDAVAALGVDWAAAGTDDPARAATLADQLEGVRMDFAHARNTLNERVALRDNIAGQLARVDQNTEVAENLQARQQKLQIGLAVAEAVRRSFVEEVLDSICDEVNRLYDAIHPGEDSGLDRLYMDENRRGSLEQRCRFSGVGGVVPQAYFSESHLDTLGFCFWLALAKRSGADRAILVLDDVFTSVDAQHYRRISDLLVQESTHFRQLIIATHSRTWRQFYATSGHVHGVQLAAWSLGSGIRPFEDPGAIERLAAEIAALPFPRQAVASQAGIVLEQVLDEVAMLYGCSVPRQRDPRYTLGALLSTTKKTLRAAQIRRAAIDPDTGAPSWETIDVKPLVDAIDGLGFIRNQVGAHFNLDGLSLADADVAAFGTAAHGLAAALVCPRCGRLPSKNKAAHWGCSCPAHKTELTPLEKK